MPSRHPLYLEAINTFREKFARLDELTAQLPKDTSRDLLHYLHKKSFQKARLFLQGQDPEQGECPH